MIDPEAYLRLNAKYSDPFLFGLTNRGFYSEVNNLLNAILFGLVKKRRLYVDQSGFADGQLCWSDLYRSSLPWSPGDLAGQIDPLWMITWVKTQGFAELSIRINRWHRYHRFFLSRSYGFHASVFAAKRQLARSFCRPVAACEPPAALKAPYAAIHVRRGDKVEGFSTSQGGLIVEGEGVPLSRYLALVRERSPQIRSLFVMTDDHRTVEEVCLLDPGIDVFSFCQKSDQGYQQQEFNAMNSASKTAAMKRLIAEVEIASRSEVFVGCYKSNVSRYIALVHQYPHQCFSLDGERRWHPV